MNETVFTTIALTGFSIAFFHAAIPTHWLPFVITARAQRWDRNKTICVTALAGTGHVLFTALLGLLIAWFGIALHDKIGAWFPWIAGGALVLASAPALVISLRTLALNGDCAHARDANGEVHVHVVLAGAHVPTVTGPVRRAQRHDRCPVGHHPNLDAIDVGQRKDLYVLVSGAPEGSALDALRGAVAGRSHGDGGQPRG
jgi:hypothetical protein